MASESIAAEFPRSRTSDGLNLSRFAWAVVWYNVLVILWGALVRATGSGAGCGNHWPLCNGQVIPVSPGFHTIIEFAHRMMTGGATFLILGLLIWVFVATQRGAAVRVFAVSSLVLLINEAILGALLVKLGYVTTNQSTGRVVVLGVHLSNTLLLLAALTLTAWFAETRQSWRDVRKGRNIGWGVGGAVATIVVGVTGSLAALGDTLFPSGSLSAAFAQDFTAGAPLLLKLRLIHPISALLAGAFVVWLITQRGEERRVTRGRRRLVLWLLGLQFALGIADVLLLAPAWMQLLHLLGADLYWVALIALAAETLWPMAVEYEAGSAAEPVAHGGAL